MAFEDLFPIPPVHNGLDLLDEVIKKRETVLCLCRIARDNHLGVHDAERHLSKWQRRGLIQPPKEVEGQKVYWPVNDAPDMVARFRTQELELVDDYRFANEVLVRAYPDYDPERWADVSVDVPSRTRFQAAFATLRRAGILPPTTGNSLFNRQGMILIMVGCFFTRRGLVEYLRDFQMGAPVSATA